MDISIGFNNTDEWVRTYDRHDELELRLKIKCERDGMESRLVFCVVVKKGGEFNVGISTFCVSTIEVSGS